MLRAPTARSCSLSIVAQHGIWSPRLPASELQRSVPGASYGPIATSWLLSARARVRAGIRVVMTTMRAKRTVSAPRRASTAAAPAAPAPRAAPERAHVLDVPFAMRAVASASGARWDAEHGVFVVRAETLPPALAPFRAAPYSWERRVEHELNDDPAPAPAAPAGAMVLRPHQLDGVRAIAAAKAARRAGFLLADDVGLGKTITAWAAVLEMPDVTTVLIVCPLAVVAHWRRTVQAMGDAGKEIVIINYDRLGKLFEVTPEARRRIRSKKGLARAGSAAEFDVVIWDESHRCKNPAAARSKLAVKLNARARFVLWLSATAGQNPLELSYLAPLLASATGSRSADLKDFEQWCEGQGLGVARGAFGRWDWRGDPADCEKVRALLFDGRPAVGMRRRPEDVAGWPAINRILTPLELDASARELYAQAWTAFRREMDLLPKGANPRSALAATLRLRQKSSLIRVAGTVELVRELLDNGHQVAVSIAFMETLEAVEAALARERVPCALIHGALPAGEKEAERLRFQRGEPRVVLFTVEEGISLHQGEHNEVPRSEVIHDLRWSAIQMAQIEGRCHRDGRFAQVYWAYADDTVEDKIAEIVCRRIRSMKAMVGDDVETMREIERLLAGAD
ncbi:SNF2-related protein [Sorangium atrum]|uniref:DEAD/DEAH box helicase n=1 Tax=Sorangium atrum TaxID=2995308 RepID=A0ABT5BVK2_9BACT|nr:DEAD/DEAH box helicase [Sorangium aterium]MDC0677718.1 DEAD/DEAH box helicase [Sorangium aterium]